MRRPESKAEKAAKVAKRSGLGVRRKPRPLTIEEEERILEMAKSGMRYEDIAIRANRRTDFINKLLNSKGYRRNNRRAT